jgi:HK97 family phage major capsid protein/HK97 family phage prohead protease
MLYRTLHLETRDDAARTCEASVSSELPVFRPGLGREILLHGPDNIDLQRQPLPLITSHDAGALPVGVVDNLRVIGKKLRGTLRFGTSARAQEIWRDVQAGVIRNLSIGYEIIQGHAQGQDYIVSKWRPFEVSLVAVPADPTVGIGRSFDFNSGKDNVMLNDTTENTIETDVAVTRSQRRAAARAQAAANERVEEIIALGELHAKRGGERLAMQALRSGMSVDEFRAQLLDHMANKPIPLAADIGMSEREARRFSFVKAIRAQLDPEFARRECGFELEVSRAVAQRLGREPQGLFVPVDVLQRDLNVGTASAGGNLVATNLLAANFIDLLRVQTAVLQLGATVLPGLVGNVAIPRQTAGATAYWVTEGNAPTESQPAFDQVTLSPKTVGAFTDISRKLVLQSTPAVEWILQQDLAAVLGAEIDRAAIAGSGSGAEPRGILNTTGIGNVEGGTNGAAPTWTHIVALESALATANVVDGSTLAYLTNAKVRGKLKTTQIVPTYGDTMIWADGPTPVNGYRAAVSNNVPSNLSKGTSTGVCSAILFGNWSDLLIGQWGALDLLVDPYTASASGTVRIRVLQDVDIAVRHPESFAAMKDALTT